MPDYAKDGTKPESSRTWISEMIPRDGSQVQILRFEYRIPQDGNSIWQHLSMSGEVLLRALTVDVGTRQVQFGGSLVVDPLD